MYAKGMRFVVYRLTLQAMSFSSLHVLFIPYRIFFLFYLQVIKTQEGWSFFISFIFPGMSNIKGALFLLVICSYEGFPHHWDEG